LALTSLVAACTANPQGSGGPVVSGAASAGTETAMLVPRTGKLTPETLKGLSAAQAESELGQPSFRRRDPPAEIWQYRVRSCTLDLFLYEEGDTRVVNHFAVRTPGGTAISDRGCLDDVLTRQIESPTS
ncbi:MAG: hypothetical protein J0626_05755, partial [Rhodospirillaceae bacterium]|nr:hypothetical protein [Rhodospirillaceae bacterium]